jgi:hypothetical protein
MAMSFLDNLENNLKALESRESQSPEDALRERERRDAERKDALQRAPHAAALRTSPFTSELLKQCRTIGHQKRVLVQYTWLGEVLRLDARGKRLELVPTAAGIEACSSVDGEPAAKFNVDPGHDDPAAVAASWLAG